MASAIAIAAVNAVTKCERTSLGGDAFFLSVSSTNNDAWLRVNEIPSTGVSGYMMPTTSLGRSCVCTNRMSGSFTSHKARAAVLDGRAHLAHDDVGLAA